MKLYELFKKKVFHIDLGLDRVKKALKDLDNPQESFKSVLISGTNGKGSTSAFLESLLRHSDFKVGLFTSPHLIDERERWQINREYISQEELEIYINRIKPLIEKYNLTYFEASTVLAFLYFADKKVDFAVLEVGLGGRFDATNVVYPDISIITNVSFDHTHILGNTLEKIAFEKLGIGRKDRPLVIGSNQTELINQAKILGIGELYYLNRDFFYKSYIEDLIQKVDYKFKNLSISGIEIKLLGDRQANNLATALTGYILLMERLGKAIDLDLIKKAVFNTSWQGRMEIVSKNPLVIVDGAHNEDALQKSFKELKNLFQDKNIITFISFMKDKDFKKLMDIALKFSKDIFFVEMPFDRSLKSKELKRYYPNIKTLSISDIQSYIHKDSDNIFFITGSLYFVGEVLKGWREGKQT